MTKHPDLLKRLALLKPVIWQEVQNHLPGKPSHPHYRMVQDYSRRKGKYFRPALFLLALELFGVNWRNHLDLAAALQLCEDWMLIHDDVEDESNERRGGPSLNALYGSGLAINAGDALHAAMWKTVYCYLEREHVHSKKALLRQFHQIINTTIEGQFEELWWTRNKKVDIPYSAYYNMVLKKTCYYTIVGPVRLAGIIAGIPEQKIADIEAWTIPFGKSFQIWDDVLDNTEDIGEAKRTLMLLHLLKHCTNKEKREVVVIYNKERNHKTVRDIRSISRLMDKYGSIEFAAKRAQNFSRIAMEQYKHFTAEFPDSPSKSQIQEAITFVITRTH